MAEKGYGFNRQSAERIARAVKWSEREQARKSPARGFVAPGWKVIVGKADAACTAPDDVTVSVYAYTGSSTVPASESDITDTGNNITAFNLFGDIDSGAWVCCIWAGGFWLVIAAECPA